MNPHHDDQEHNMEPSAYRIICEDDEPSAPVTVRQQLTKLVEQAQHRLTATPVPAMAAGAAVALIAAGALLYLLWQLLAAIGRGLGHLSDGADTGAAWITEHAPAIGNWIIGPLTHTITDPIHHYLHTHTTGLPVTGAQAFTLWVTAVTLVWGAGALLASRAARAMWPVIGATTTAAVYAGTTSPAAATAAGITVIVWALLSLPVYGRDAVVVIPTSWPRRTPPEPELADLNPSR